MAKARHARQSRAVDQQSPVAAARPRTGIREVDLLAALALALCVAITWLSRYTLNPDGVSYFDLATALRRGDIVHFVQPYWSPLYPVLLACVGGALHAAAAGMTSIAHLVNLFAVLPAIAVVWHWSRRMATPFFGRAAFAALLTCSGGLPPVEPVTSDIILVGIAAWISYELIAHTGRRWRLCGVLLGAAYLTKTSVWPWLVIAAPLRLWRAPDRAARMRVLRSSMVAAGVALLWIIPVSLKDGHATFGATGRLNFNWYVEGRIVQRAPDTDPGQHIGYYNVSGGDGPPLTFARFADAGTWTYQPWSDPAAWDAGILTHMTNHVTLNELVLFWGKLTWQGLRYWLLPLLLAVLVPMVIAGRRSLSWRGSTTADRDALTVATLGLIGLAQYFAVHAEPRLLAPFGLMLGLGVLGWVCGPVSAGNGSVERCSGLSGPAAPTWLWHFTSTIGFVAVVILARARIREAVANDHRGGEIVRELAAANRRLGIAGPGHHRIVIIGAAIPDEAAVYWTGGRIVAQLLPRSLADFRRLPAERQVGVIDSLFAGQADVAWMMGPDSKLQLATIPP